MDKSLKNLKADAISMGISFLISITLLKIVFYNSEFTTIVRTVFSFFWIIAIPGFAIMYFWNDKLKFAERFVLGCAVGFSVIGVLSYYLGLFGLNILYLIIPLPIVISIIPVLILKLKK